MVHAWYRFLKGNYFLFAWHNSQHSEILYPHPTAAFWFIRFSEETGAEASQSSDPPWLLPVTLSSHSVSAEIPPQKQEAEDHSRRWHVSSGYCGLEKCAYWSDPQPAELRVLTEPTHQSDYHIMFLGSWIRSILIVCGESLLPGPMFGRVLPWGSFFSRGLSCFLIPEVLPIPPVLSNSELWDPGGRISTGNAWCAPAVFMNTCSKSKRRPLFELDVENQSSFFNHKKLLTWKDLKGLESTPPPTLTFRISSVNLKRNKQKENHSPDIS